MAQINTDLETLKTARDNMKTALEEKGQTVTKDIRTYATAISNIETGGGDTEGAKIFSTVNEMNNSSGNQMNDLAIVYNFTTTNWTASTYSRYVFFPSSVTLATEVTETINQPFYGGDEMDQTDATATLKPTEFKFSFDYWGETSSSSGSVVYTSVDGIHYILATGQIQLDCIKNLHFGYMWEEENELEFDSRVGQFMNKPTEICEGIYKYDNITRKNEYVRGGYVYVFPQELIDAIETEIIEPYNPAYCAIMVIDYIENENRRSITECEVYTSYNAQTWTFFVEDTNELYIGFRKDCQNAILPYNSNTGVGTLTVVTNAMLQYPINYVYTDKATGYDADHCEILSYNPSALAGERYYRIPTKTSKTYTSDSRVNGQGVYNITPGWVKKSN